mmetsp:Transcript_159067/g.486828  ORF Transcript_159067/g.486828 Transcript_159067/m.486828 type:complete len:224 (-) Transcript_159067:625-1296(-)
MVSAKTTAVKRKKVLPRLVHASGRHREHSDGRRPSSPEPMSSSSWRKTEPTFAAACPTPLEARGRRTSTRPSSAVSARRGPPPGTSTSVPARPVDELRSSWTPSVRFRSSAAPLPTQDLAAWSSKTSSRCFCLACAAAADSPPGRASATRARRSEAFPVARATSTKNSLMPCPSSTSFRAYSLSLPTALVKFGRTRRNSRPTSRKVLCTKNESLQIACEELSS